MPEVDVRYSVEQDICDSEQGKKSQYHQNQHLLLTLGDTCGLLLYDATHLVPSSKYGGVVRAARGMTSHTTAASINWY